MTQQVYKPSHIFWSKLISFFIKPLYSKWTSLKHSQQLSTLEINSILVTEYHRIGDVIMIKPALEGLRKQYPNAKITLVCHPSAVSLASNLIIADSIIGLEVPWTNWNWSLSKWIHVKKVIQQLGPFDVAIDFKGDLRNNWLLWHSDSKVRLGFTATGGAYFLTHPYDFPFQLHQSHRAISLVSMLGVHDEISITPLKNNLSGSIVIHSGASDPRRSLVVEKWVELVKSLSVIQQVTLVKTPETIGLIKQSKQAKLNFETFEGDLVQFSNWLASQRILIAPDSMAGHLGALSGIPVISIFGSQDPTLTSPLGKSVEIISPKYPCSHKKSHWRLCEKCVDSISVSTVESVAKRVLSTDENAH